MPLPIGNGEQFFNAASLVEAKRAELIAQSDFTAQFLSTNLTALLERAAAAPLAGDAQDLHAAAKIVALAEFALKS